MLAEAQSDDGPRESAVAQITDVESLPTDWFGYEGVNVLVLATGDVAFCERLATDAVRFEALRRWLELGGRLVVFCGRTAPDLLSADHSLADFVPGKFTELVRLPQTQPLESYAGSGDAISPSGARQERQGVPLASVVDVDGRVELFGRGHEFPIVVRSARGLGELTFVAVDLTESPLAEWTGRRVFLRRVLRPYISEPGANKRPRKLVSLGYDDLAGALRQRLGHSFAGVAAVGFPLVAALVIGYLLLLGPLDYLFVERVVRRPWIAWLTLPVIVLATSVAAALFAGAAKRTDGPRLNHAELVDFDLSTGRVRGTCWATLYSSHAERCNVSLAPRMPAGRPAKDTQTLVSWLGLPGSGLGGMHSAGEPINVTGTGYREAASRSALVQMPVLTAATKSLYARWDNVERSTARPLAAELRVGDDGLVQGTVTNDTGATLSDACLLYGQWGYRLGDVKPGQRLEVGPNLGARSVKSIVARRARRGATAGLDTFLAGRADVDELLNVMMFYEVVGGEGFAGLPNRYQSDCDLSRLLALDRAILVATGPGRGSQWTDSTTGKPLSNEHDQSTVIYRFVLPVTLRPPTSGPSP